MSWFIQWENSIKSNEKIPAAPPVFDFLETEACPRITELMVWQ
jgi:hypothetical protein